jgi:hypothetical protein
MSVVHEVYLVANLVLMKISLRLLLLLIQLLSYKKIVFNNIFKIYNKNMVFYFSFISFNCFMFCLFHFLKKNIKYNIEGITNKIIITNEITDIKSPLKSFRKCENNYMTLQLTIADRIADRLNPLKSSRE